MTVNIIHLKKRIDRYSLLRRELKEQNITDYQFWDGITSETTPRQNIAKAHKQIVQYAKENNLEEVCIAEDDFHFPAKDGYEYFLNNKPESYDIYLSGVYFALTRKDFPEHTYNGLHFYLVHSRFYDAFLNLDTSNQDLDNALSEQSRLLKCKIVIIFPYACIQHESRSDNSQCIFEHKYFFNSKNTYGFVDG